MNMPSGTPNTGDYTTGWCEGEFVMYQNVPDAVGTGHGAGNHFKRYKKHGSDVSGKLKTYIPALDQCNYCIGDFIHVRNYSRDAPRWETFVYSYQLDDLVTDTKTKGIMSFVSLDHRPEHSLIGHWHTPLLRNCQHYSGFCFGEMEM